MYLLYIYIKKSNEIRMLVHIKEISKKKNKTDFSQHFCTNVFTAVADLQVQYIYIEITFKLLHTASVVGKIMNIFVF
jgi:hypothetical protein